jgi:hypothetical protein
MISRQMLHYQQSEDKNKQLTRLRIDVKKKRRRFLIRSVMLHSFSKYLKTVNSNIQNMEETIHAVVTKIVSFWTDCSYVNSVVEKKTLQYSI